MSDFAFEMLRHQRLVVLLVLLRSPSRQASVGVLRISLQTVGFHPSHATMVTMLDWLHDNGFVVKKTLEHLGQSIQVAHLTQEGADIANGSAEHDGIRRPDLFAVPQTHEGVH